jgi:hypothetical protein
MGVQAVANRNEVLTANRDRDLLASAGRVLFSSARAVTGGAILVHRLDAGQTVAAGDQTRRPASKRMVMR